MSPDSARVRRTLATAAALFCAWVRLVQRDLILKIPVPLNVWTLIGQSEPPASCRATSSVVRLVAWSA